MGKKAQNKIPEVVDQSPEAEKPKLPQQPEDDKVEKKPRDGKVLKPVPPKPVEDHPLREGGWRST